MAKPPPEGTLTEFKTPLPTFGEYGISFMFGKDEIEKPNGRMFRQNNFE